MDRINGIDDKSIIQEIFDDNLSESVNDDPITIVDGKIVCLKTRLLSNGKKRCAIKTCEKTARSGSDFCIRVCFLFFSLFFLCFFFLLVCSSFFCF